MSPQTIKCEPVADWSLAIGSKRPTVLLQTWGNHHVLRWAKLLWFLPKGCMNWHWNGSMRRSALSWFTGSNRNYIGLLHILTTILLWFLLIQYIYIIIYISPPYSYSPDPKWLSVIWFGDFMGPRHVSGRGSRRGHFDKGNGWKWMVNHWDWYRAIISEKSSFIMNWWVMMSHVYRVDMIKKATIMQTIRVLSDCGRSGAILAIDGRAGISVYQLSNA